MPTLRDKLWIWGHEAGSHSATAERSGWGGLRPSRMTPAEAAFYMGIDRVIMVVFNDQPRPPFDQHAKALAPFKEVVWSILGDMSSTRNEEQSDLDEVLRIAGRHPNVTGAIMDDFLREGQPRYSREAIGEIRDRLHGGPRGLDLWVVLYDYQLDLDLAPFVELCDTITFWTWKGSELVHLRENVERFETLFPTRRRLLGCYMWDYGEKHPMSVKLMQQQCELGREWLHQGRIDGMIFLASCICDLDLEAVEWTRDWIACHGDETLTVRPD